MRLEHYSSEKLRQDILGILGKYLDLAHYRVFFFGSRVTGTGTDRSDIDVGIEGPAVPQDQWLAIQEEFENLPVLYKVDIVDFSQVSPRFRDVALQHIEPIPHPAS